MIRYGTGQKTYCTEFCVLWVHSVPDFEVSVYRGTALSLGRIKGHPRALSRHVPRKRHITSASRLLSSRSITRYLLIFPSSAVAVAVAVAPAVLHCARAYYAVLYSVLCALVQCSSSALHFPYFVLRHYECVSLLCSKCRKFRQSLCGKI